MKITLGYSDSDDRLWLRIEGSTSIWWLTRRIALNLMRHWGAMIERSYRDGAEAASSPEAAPPAPQRARSAHRAALASAAPVEPVGRPPAGVEMHSRLVSSIDLSLSADRFTLLLRGTGGQDTVRMSRDEAHRMIEALHARCRISGWLDAPLPAWLSGGSPAPPETQG